MIILAWVISIIASLLLGFFFSKIWSSIKNIQQDLLVKIDKPKKEEKKSMILDPDDPVQKTLEEHAELMRRLNPGGK